MSGGEWTPMDVVARVREYTNRDGEVKGVYTNHGTCWAKDGVATSIVLESLPVAQYDEKLGRNVIKLSIFPRKEREEKPAPSNSKPRAPAKPRQEALDDDIPF